ncbi:MAG: hypothetical protein DRJ68_01480 [Thermoprotei archaeon]|nr:MAG: hypothetical protein DRJ68_01480 [Thermoprotei archaeon]
MSGGNFSALSGLTSRVAEKLREASGLYVLVTHYDADGLASASIIARLLMKLDRDFVIRVVDQLDELSLQSLPRGDFYVFTDLGSSSIESIAKMGFTPAIVLDHHEPLRGQVKVEDTWEVNPHLVGINGGREISASGLAYLVAKHLNLVDHDMAYLAVTGAVGDRQDSAPNGLVGPNKLIVEEAMSKGWISSSSGLRLYGVPRYPLVKSLMYTVDPLLPGLTYDEAACQRFLEVTGIPAKKADGSPMTYGDLRPEEKSRLATALIKHLLAKGINPQAVDSLFGFTYEFLFEAESSPLRYAHEYAQLLNACGRLKRHGVGLAIGLGDRERALSQAEAISLEYRRRLAQYLSLIRNDPSYIRLLNNIQVLKLSGLVDDRVLGAVSSIVLSSYMCDVSRPLVSLTTSSHGRIKVSVRVHESLSRRGVDIGPLVKEAAEKVGGSGGGHAVAAGAIIPEEGCDVFLKLLDETMGLRLARGG